MIEYEDMSSALDTFAEMVTKDVDIEFEVKKVRFRDMSSALDNVVEEEEPDGDIDDEEMSRLRVERKVVITRRSRVHHTLAGEELPHRGVFSLKSADMLSVRQQSDESHGTPSPLHNELEDIRQRMASESYTRKNAANAPNRR